MRRMLSLVPMLLVLTLVWAPRPAAQSKPTLTPADYERFETVAAASARGGLSPDGQWLAYTLAKAGGDSELRITRVGGQTTHVVPFGSGASYASTSQWVAYGIGQSEAEAERLRTARQPVERKLGLINLATGAQATVNGIDAFAFDRTGHFLAMKRAASAAAGSGAPAASPSPAPGGRGGGGGAAAASPAGAVGTTLIVRNLATGADMTFGNVTEYAWQASDTGRLLAMTIGTDGQAGNGIQLYDPETSVLRVLDAAPVDYSALAWRPDSADLLALKAKTDAAHDGATQLVLVWTNVGEPAERRQVLDHTAGPSLAANQRLVTSRRPSWLTGPADAGAMVLVGVADWPLKPAAPEGGRGGRGAAPDAVASEKANVDVWHWTDTTVMSAQKISLAADRRRSLPAVWHLDGPKLIVLGQSFDENVSPIRGTTKALVSDYTPYLMERSIGRGLTDIYLADMTTGARTLLKKGVGGAVSASTGGKYAIYADGRNYFTIDLTTKAVVNITAQAQTSFADTESDSTSPQRPMFGIGGWTRNDEAVVLYDKFDIWKVSPSGKMGSKCSSGAGDQMRVRLVSLGGQPGDPVDLNGAWVSLFGATTKQSGYGRLDGGTRRVVWLDKSVTALAKAEKADVYTYMVQSADDSPDLFVGGPELGAAAPVTNTNAFLSQYAWPRAMLVDYTITRGKTKIPLQGILHYPANYEPGRKYPMVVYLYEKLSDNLHRFTAPSERDYYNGAAFTQNGYFYFQPDIVFAPGEPGVSVVECVSAAVNAVVSRGEVDGAKVGVMGHSWGGFDAMFLATHTKIFAAAVSGAGIADLVSNYGNGHWSSGIAETDHIETGQQRMVVPLYDDLDRYIRNSAIFSIATMTTPLLMEAGDSDGTVFWHQSVELYNIARRAKKNVVMLVYNGEDHSLRAKKNQIDYQHRIHEWFDHYLKGAAAPAWITQGVPALARDGR